jgi:hypothetical protein
MLAGDSLSVYARVNSLCGYLDDSNSQKADPECRLGQFGLNPKSITTPLHCETLIPLGLGGIE